MDKWLYFHTATADSICLPVRDLVGMEMDGSGTALDIRFRNAASGDDGVGEWSLVTEDSEEKISSKYYFTRVRNNEFNFTTNPSFIDTQGNVIYSTFINNPKTFITTVGLYNNDGDLVAVAKISQPVAKDFTKEALIRVKLDY